MSPRIEGAGVELAYAERGDGPPVLLVHGIGEGLAALELDLEALAPRAHAIGYDRRGYGSSTAPEAYERTTVEEQAQDAAAVLEGLSVTGAVVAGRDFGALVCLDLLRRHAHLARAAVLTDPWFFMLSPEANEALGAERAALQEMVFEYGPAEAVRRFGRHPGEHRGFFADYGGTASWGVTRPELRAITAPVAILTTPGAPAHVAAAATALAGLLPGAGEVEPGGDAVSAIQRRLAR